MRLDITKEYGEFKVKCPDLHGLMESHPSLSTALRDYGRLVQDYYESLKSRKNQLADNLKQELEILKEVFE